MTAKRTSFRCRYCHKTGLVNHCGEDLIYVYWSCDSCGTEWKTSISLEVDDDGKARENLSDKG